MKCFKWFSLITFLLLFLVSCAPKYEFIKSEIVSELELTFADGRWDGVTIPPGETCISCGGNGATPELIVKNIPPEANALILYFQKGRVLNINPNYIKGGNGVLGYYIPEGSDEVKVPSVQGQSSNLPENFFSLKRPMRQIEGQNGMYLPPCYCMGINRELWYLVHVKAVYLASSDDENSIEYASGTLSMGRVRQ